VAVDYPIGHRRRRAEGIPQLEAKFERNLATLFGAEQRAAILAACADQARFETLPVAQFMALWVPPS
jgi:2-methylcitrate dehydratase